MPQGWASSDDVAQIVGLVVKPVPGRDAGGRGFRVGTETGEQGR